MHDVHGAGSGLRQQSGLLEGALPPSEDQAALPAPPCGLDLLTAMRKAAGRKPGYDLGRNIAEIGEADGNDDGARQDHAAVVQPRTEADRFALQVVEHVYVGLVDRNVFHSDEPGGVGQVAFQ